MIDLFSGIGGFSLAATWVWGDDLEIVSFVEKDKYCQKILNKNFPGVLIYDDIKTFDGTTCGTVDLITGGFPCQPFSVAGKQKGKEDDRYLWPEMLRVISEIRPSWVIGENVAGIVKLVLDDVLTDLESLGYSTQSFIIPACAVNAPHRRDRVWIVGNAKCGRCDREKISIQSRGSQQKEFMSSRADCLTADTEGGRSGCQQDDHRDTRFQQDSERREGVGKQLRNNNTNASDSQSRQSWKQTKPERREDIGRGSWQENWYEVATRLCRMDDGVSNRVDRLRSLGNAIVPQVVYQIMNGIKYINAKSN